MSSYLQFSIDGITGLNEEGYTRPDWRMTRREMANSSDGVREGGRVEIGECKEGGEAVTRLAGGN